MSSTPNQPEFLWEVESIIRAAFRFKWRALLTFVLVVTLFLFGIAISPRKYQSESKLFVKVGRESVGLDASATVGPTVSLNETRESELGSVAELLGSRGMIETIVDRLGPDKTIALIKSESSDIEPGDDESEGGFDLMGFVMSTAQSLNIADKVSLRERAIQKLSKAVGSKAVDKTNVVSVSVKARNPENAKLLLTEIINEYLETHPSANRTTGSFRFFQTQAATLKTSLETAEQQLRDRKSEFGVTVIEDRRKNLQNQKDDLASAIRSNKANVAASQQRLEELKRILKEEPERKHLEDVEGVPNRAHDEMRARLYQLEIQEKNLRARFDDNHPKVIEIRKNVTEAKRILDEESKDHKESKTAINETWNLIRQRVLLAQSELTAQQAIATEYQSQVKLLAQEIDDVNHQESIIEKLKREIAILKSDYTTYKDKLELARIDQRLAEEQISNVNVVQQPTISERPKSPNKVLWLAAGLFFGGICSFATVVFSSRRR